MITPELRALALAATPGKWAVSPATSSYFGVRTVCGRMLFTSIIRSSQEEAQANAAYIAALSPERVLAMIAVIEAAMAMRHYFPHIPTQDFRHGDITAAFDAALAALDKEQK